MVLQGIDARLHSRMFSPRSNKLIGAFNRLLFFAQSSFFRQHRQIQYPFQLLSVFGGVEIL